VWSVKRTGRKGGANLRADAGRNFQKADSSPCGPSRKIRRKKTAGGDRQPFEVTGTRCGFNSQRI
jgi:hypothetical protein